MDKPTLIYVYAIVRAGQVADAMPVPITGVDDAIIEGLIEGSLEALFSWVSPDIWGADILDEHVRNMDWLAPRATQHQQVLATLQAEGRGMLPLPFATLYHQPENVRDLLRTRQTELTMELERLQDTEEWTLKVSQDQDVFDQHVERLSPALAQAVEESRSAAPGRAYLLRKQLDTLRRGEAAHVITRQCDEIEQRIAALVTATVREPIARQARAASADQQTDSTMRVVLKLALLLHQDTRATVQNHLGSIASEYSEFGYIFELAGPWPPYSFARLRSEKDH